jgi:hypothetical protein
MTTQAPTWVALRMVQLAARILPSAHRDRYEGEFTAELYGMARYHQIRHATQILARAWALRAALDAAPLTIGQEIMSHVRARLNCLIRRHRWRSEYDHATKRTTWECLRCGAHKLDFHSMYLNPSEYDGGPPLRGP